MPRVRADRFQARVCCDSYYEFFKTFWPLIAAEPLVDSWYVRQTCDKLQEICERIFADEPKEYDFVYNCPPGTSKSSMVSVLLQPWCWSRMPSLRVISGSYAERLALDLSRKSRDVVLSDKYRAFYPDVKLREDQNTKGYFANTAGGIRYAVGVGGTVIGMHAHLLLVDDPIDPQGVLSDLALADSNAWMDETLSRRKVNVMLTPLILIMQRLHQNDPTGNVLGKGGRVLNWVFPGDSSWEVKPPEMACHYERQAGLMDQKRLPRQALEEALLDLGEAGYAGQYGQNPVPRGGAMFKVDQLSYQHVAPARWKRGPVRFWDKAATRGGGAFSAGVKAGVDEFDNFWVLDSSRGQWDSGTRERRIDQTAVLDGRATRVGVEQEPGSGGKESAEGTQRRLALRGYRCSVVRPSGDKEQRADPVSVLVNQGKVVILVGAWNRAFVEELRFFPRSKYKDQVDALSGAFSLLTQRRIRVGTWG